MGHVHLRPEQRRLVERAAPGVRAREGLELRDVLGFGGFGIVMRARGSAGETVAVKLFDAQTPPTPEEALAMTREIGTGLRCRDNPRVPRHDRLVISAEHAYLVREAVKGDPLARAFARAGAEERVAIVRELAIGLRDLHERGVVHRDIKGENAIVLRAREEVGSSGGVSSDGPRSPPPRSQVWWLDLGSARVEGESGPDPDFVRRPLLGAPFAPPEFRQGGEWGRTGDAYAFGCMLRDLFSERSEELPAAGRLREPRIPEDWIRTIVSRLLEERPADRWPLRRVVQALEGEGAPEAEP